MAAHHEWSARSQERIEKLLSRKPGKDGEMKLRLERIASDGDSTIGILFVDAAFECFTLEDEHRALKVKGETRIPAGTYRIDLRTEGGLTKVYGNRYGAMHRGMLWLRDVPDFEWIYIHTGNRDEHTEGCILVGEQCLSQAGDMAVLASRPAYRNLYPRLATAAAAGNLSIDIVDRDR